VPELVTCPHEHAALCAATGDAMVRRRPSMTAAHADLGLLHHGGALHNAFRGRYPALLTSGYPPTTPELRTAPVYWQQQRWDQGGVVRQYVKWDHRLAAHDDPDAVVGRALQVSMSPPPGPAYLAVPAEVTRLPSTSADEVSPSGPSERGTVPASPAGEGAALAVPELPGGDADQADEIADRLLAAEAPLVLTDRVGDDPASVARLDELAAEFGLALTATRHRMNVRDDHPCLRHGVALGDADALLVLEHPVPWVPAREQPRAEAWVGVVGTDPAQLEVPLYELGATTRLQADPRRFLGQLTEALRRRSRAEQRERARARTAWWAAAEPPQPARPSTGVPSMLDIGRALSATVGEDDLVCWEAVGTRGLARRRPGTLFEKGGSSLGWAVGAAIGARAASGDQPTVALTGDGSYLFGSPTSTLWLQQHLDAPVLTVIVNNGGYRTGTAALAADYPDGDAVAEGSFRGGVLDPSPDHAAHARSQGGYGRRVTDVAELIDAVAGARRAVERDRVPAVVDVRVEPHVPRRPAARSSATTPATPSAARGSA
jgi:acetolactate synthase-1/2/3 large subunit